MDLFLRLMMETELLSEKCPCNQLASVCQLKISIYFTTEPALSYGNT